MKLKITKDGNGVYSLWEIAGWFDKDCVFCSRSISAVLSEMKRRIGTRIETTVVEVESIEEEA